ncbi:hypothetical protein NAD41_000858 [Salmonella enterica]|nr:hypothetical protein [Salmonella enterica]EKK6596242.1 hypothetical protein [Salmonella enterica]
MADPATTTPAVDIDPRAGTGRESIVPPQVDAQGNSIITGKPATTAFDIQIAEAAKRGAPPDPHWDQVAPFIPTEQWYDKPDTQTKKLPGNPKK